MLRLEIVTPDHRVLDAEVDSVTVPTASGEVGILPNHASLVSALKPGVLSYGIKGAVERLVVTGGWLGDLEQMADAPNIIHRFATRRRETSESPLPWGRRRFVPAVPTRRSGRRVGHGPNGLLCGRNPWPGAYLLRITYPSSSFMAT